jgi:hypothetical protein
MNARKSVRRKTPRLAYPEYVSPNPQDSIQGSRARLLLFETVNSVFPKMLIELLEKVFPPFEELAVGRYIFWAINGPRHKSPYELLTQTSAASSGGYKADTPDSIQKRCKLKSALDAWANEFNVSEGWAKDEVVRTLDHWHRDPEGRKSRSWNPIYSHYGRASTGEPFQFHCLGWETELHSWPRYSEWVRQSFEEHLCQYEKETRKLAESCGLVRAQLKYSPANFEWFVLYQFAGLSSTGIADTWPETPADCVDESTVLKGINAAAKLIGWNSVRNPQGEWSRKGKRPRKIL